MLKEHVKYLEPLNEDELSFLKKKTSKESKMLMYVMKWAIIASVLIPISFANFLIGFLFLLLFSCGCIYIVYYSTLRKVYLDIAHQNKIIERCVITRKLFMDINNKYYFYINSSQKLSIEVSENFYNSLNEGDEVSIEYTQHAKLYLGYF